MIRRHGQQRRIHHGCLPWLMLPRLARVGASRTPSLPGAVGWVLIASMKLHVLVAVGLVWAVSVMAAEKNWVGEPLPKLSVNFLGTEPELEGKAVLLEFWATWCPPCRESIPHLNELHAKFKDRGLQIVGVTDEANSVIRKFQKEVPMDYPTATDTGGRLNKKMGVSGIPAAFLANKAGVIVWQGHPATLKDADIEKALAE